MTTEETKGNVVELDRFRPHTTALVVCNSCEVKWAAVFPSTLGVDKLECPYCNCIGKTEYASEGPNAS